MLRIVIRTCVIPGRTSQVRSLTKMPQFQHVSARGLLAACSQVFTGSLTAISSLPRFFCRRFMSHKPRKKKFTVCIEGNIGSGKTSLLKHFMKKSDVEVLMEPVNKWRNIDGHNGLALMYEDPTRWALSFQTYVQLTMLEAHTSPTNKPVKLMERSIFSAKYCFVENLYKSGKMPEVEYIILTKWFDWIVSNGDVDIDLIVYLRTSPETAHERIRRRCRKEEEAIPIEYLRQLHELHEDWLIRESSFTLPCPVLVLEADKDLSDMEDEFDLYRQRILCGQG